MAHFFAAGDLESIPADTTSLPLQSNISLKFSLPCPSGSILPAEIAVVHIFKIGLHITPLNFAKRRHLRRARSSEYRGVASKRQCPSQARTVGW